MEERSGANGRHPDPLALDALRAGAGTAADEAHVAACARCREALAELALLAERLRAAEPPVPAVPRELELRILRGYREGFGARAPIPAPGPLRRWVLPALGAAAAAALLLTVNPVRFGDRFNAPRLPSRVAGDPETPPALRPGEGVDIVDAFRLARALRDGRRPAPGWDADGSGLVDAADVRFLARRAVAL